VNFAIKFLQEETILASIVGSTFQISSSECVLQLMARSDFRELSMISNTVKILHLVGSLHHIIQ
jgi:hypothetical protein